MTTRRLAHIILAAGIAAAIPLAGASAAPTERTIGGCNLGAGLMCKAARLRGAQLAGMNLSGASLRKADLRAANLRGADLRGANLSGADLRGADLAGVDATGALMPKVRFGALRAAPRTPRLPGPPTDAGVAEQAEATSCTAGATCTGSLANGNFTRANLTGSTFSGAILTGTVFDYATLTNANFSGAVTKNTSFRGANMTGLRWQYASTGAQTGATPSIAQVDMSFANLTSTNFYGSIIYKADLFGATIANADWQYASVQYSQLLALTGTSANWHKMTFYNSEVSGYFTTSDFSNIDIYTTDYCGLHWDDATEQKKSFSLNNVSHSCYV